MAKGKVPSLQPYGKTTLVLPLQSGTWQEKEECEIAFVHKGKVQGINTFEKVNE